MFLILRSKSQARDAMSFSVQVEGVPWHVSVWDGKQVAPVVFLKGLNTVVPWMLVASWGKTCSATSDLAK
jgi:hypothetical protein